MNCKKVEDLLSAYIENDLPAAVRSEVSLHLEQCDNCTRLKEKMEELIYSFPDLEEEVPFFLKNRLLYIHESREDEQSKYYYLKYVAAVIGTAILFLNLFYFTNIYPPANRALHSVVSQIGTIVVETEAFFERLKESKNLLFYSLIKKESAENSRINKDNPIENNGGQNG
ncbi:MAG: zf-HC2 domain-containing protein [Candidatus Aminicenantes bacterium]|nr:zf-HC2 domain-containing protein [Candidatus Aminicenantes bacterium]